VCSVLCAVGRRDRLWWSLGLRSNMFGSVQPAVRKSTHHHTHTRTHTRTHTHTYTHTHIHTYTHTHIHTYTHSECVAGTPVIGQVFTLNGCYKINYWSCTHWLFVSPNGQNKDTPLLIIFALAYHRHGKNRCQPELN